MAGLEIKVEKLLYTDKGHCVLGVDKDGHRVKIVLYAPANVVLYAQLAVGGVYRLFPAAVKLGACLTYSGTVPGVTVIDEDGFPAYPSPIGVGEICTAHAETFQDIRVTVEHDFGTRDYDTKRGKVPGRALLCAGHGDQKFELVLWGEKSGGVGFKKGATVVFHDVWIRKNSSDQRPTGRMELSGSLSGFGFYAVDTLMEEIIRAFQGAADSPVRRRRISELSLQVYSPGGAETPIRDRLAELTVPGSVKESAAKRARVEGEGADAAGEGGEEAPDLSPAE